MLQPVRITKHAKPRYQHLRVGFRLQDSRWLKGDHPQEWIDHPAAEHAAWEERWNRLFGPVDLLSGTGQPTAPDDMTEAQRTAWELLSGYVDLDCLSQHNTHHVIMLETAGDAMAPHSIRFLKAHKLKIPRWAKDSKAGPSRSQLEGLTCPDSLVIENGDAIWRVKLVVDQNLARFDDQFAYHLEEAVKERDADPKWRAKDSFNYGMVVELGSMAKGDVALDKKNMASEDYQECYDYPGLEATAARYARLALAATRVFPKIRFRS
jgi:hypothetical protein